MSLNDRIKSVFWNIEDDDFEVVHRIESKPFEHFPTEFEDNPVSEAIKHHNQKWFHNELIVRATNVTVEPQCAYAVDGLRTIVGASIRTRSNLPSPVPMLKAKLFGQKTKMGKAILFDGSMGINYFHFLSDVLHKIYLLDQFTEMDCPVLVGQAVWSKPFFQFIIKETELSKYDWRLIQGAIEVGELFVSRPMPYGNKYWRKTKELLINSDNPLIERKAVFINRTGRRHIINFKEVKAVLDKHFIDVIDAGKMTMNMKQQAEFFNSATHVIGIHGAGITNVAFCNHEKVKVLELCSSNAIGTQYYWLCAALGISWDMMIGSEGDSEQSFTLDVMEFESRLERFLAQ